MCLQVYEMSENPNLTHHRVKTELKETLVNNYVNHVHWPLATSMENEYALILS